MLEKESDTFKKNNKQYFDFEIIRQKIKETMENKRITQTELGKITGIRQSRISNCLNKDNKAVFTLEEFYKICHTLGLSADDMMSLRSESKNDETLLYSLLNVIADCVLHDDLIAICIDETTKTVTQWNKGNPEEIELSSESITFSVHDKLYGESIVDTSIILNQFLGSLRKFMDLHDEYSIDKSMFETLVISAIEKAKKDYKSLETQPTSST